MPYIYIATKGSFSSSVTFSIFKTDQDVPVPYGDIEKYIALS